MTEELDPRWEWIEVSTWANPDQWRKGRCLHTQVEPVEDLSGGVVARLCLTCDRQFDLERGVWL